jgi:hypothetical protein
MKVFILTYCRKPELLYGTTLVFKTLRVGFPNAEIDVIDNNSIPEVRERLRDLARENNCGFTQIESHHVAIGHHDYLERLVFSKMEGACAFVDPDIIFWENCEEFEFDGLMGGRLIPMFQEDFGGCLTMPRLHTSFLLINEIELLRERLGSIRAEYFDFQPFTPYMFKVDTGWWRADTGASLYAALKDEVYCFSDKELNAYDHIFCGSHTDWMLGSISQEDRRDFEQIHRYAKDDYRLLRGIWRRQEKYFQSRKVEEGKIGAVSSAHALAMSSD